MSAFLRMFASLTFLGMICKTGALTVFHLVFKVKVVFFDAVLRDNLKASLKLHPKASPLKSNVGFRDGPLALTGSDVPGVP